MHHIHLPNSSVEWRRCIMMDDVIHTDYWRTEQDTDSLLKSVSCSYILHLCWWRRVEDVIDADCWISIHAKYQGCRHHVRVSNPHSAHLRRRRVNQPACPSCNDAFASYFLCVESVSSGRRGCTCGKHELLWFHLIILQQARVGETWVTLSIYLVIIVCLVHVPCYKQTISRYSRLT